MTGQAECKRWASGVQFRTPALRTRSANLGANSWPVCIGECVPMVRTWLRTNAGQFCLRDSFAHSTCVKSLRETLLEETQLGT